MKRLFAVAVIFTSLGLLLGFCLWGHSPTALAGGGGAPTCSSKNGDVNADGNVNLSDAVTILGHLFLGSPTELVPLCLSPVPSPSLPETGSRRCYDDGEKVPCLPPIDDQCPNRGRVTGCPWQGRFVENGDGTVTDNCTHLTWQKDSADVNADGKITIAGDLLSNCAALTYCNGLNFAGHDDWRLPNVRELQSIVDYGVSGRPPIDPVFGVEPLAYWSATALAADSSRGWFVEFRNGTVGLENMETVSFVRPVRSGP